MESEVLEGGMWSPQANKINSRIIFFSNEKKTDGQRLKWLAGEKVSRPGR